MRDYTELAGSERAYAAAHINSVVPAQQLLDARIGLAFARLDSRESI
jgi:hypothetical protein